MCGMEGTQASVWGHTVVANCSILIQTSLTTGFYLKTLGNAIWHTEMVDCILITHYMDVNHHIENVI